jgi:hypothetical protein
MALGQLTRVNAGAGMCEKCADFDRQIAFVRTIIKQRSADPAIIEDAHKLIEQMEAMKTLLHRGPKPVAR